ncbi:hypothetical protein LB521_04525 [Mesorhizobium sp. BR-1-1-8]|uniref:hypothetical protein n=1 Tax=Mesorhizobium sp. BR-1-1-8 TaxID=2876659 RepID=UPI001CCDB2EA|nr:hypothetical protein [Mesorhizobium sp. BR-1-1-8]MBZ9980412.1 hypothetical protein [Mesorhizobium sp. BR-1-1-8]
MKARFDFSHIRTKVGESLAEYFTRVVEGWALAESKGRVGRIRYVLHQMERSVRDEGRIEGRREVQQLMDLETARLMKRIADLEVMLRHSVSRIDAEEARQQAALAMRNKASDQAEDIYGAPTSTSVAIDDLRPPKPLWTETVRPK